MINKLDLINKLDNTINELYFAKPNYLIHSYGWLHSIYYVKIHMKCISFGIDQLIINVKIKLEYLT